MIGEDSLEESGVLEGISFENPFDFWERVGIEERTARPRHHRTLNPYPKRRGPTRSGEERKTLKRAVKISLDGRLQRSTTILVLHKGTDQ